MLALVEPHMGRTLVDMPNLGCAMLIGACARAGIPVRLVQGQTRWLADMFLRDAGELWDLIAGLDEAGVRRLGMGVYRAHLQEVGPGAFAAELRELYDGVIASRDPRAMFDAARVERLGNLATAFLAVYEDYATHRPDRPLAFIQRYVDEILSCRPRYVGFSLQCKFDPLTRVIRRLVRERAGVPVIAGGSMTPFIDASVTPDLFDRECFDYLIVGEGEEALVGLIHALDERKPLTEVPNLVFRAPDHTIRRNQRRVASVVDDLAPPDFAQFDLDRCASPDAVLPLQTARGCPWGRCAFCSHHVIYGGSYRTWSVEGIVDSIRECTVRYRCRHFAVVDEDLPARRALAIADRLEVEGLEGLSFYAYARLTAAYAEPRTLARLRRAGFSAFSWGLESGSQRMLDRMRKGTTVSCMERVLAHAAEADIVNHCFVMFGFPGETEEDASETIGFLERTAASIGGVSGSVFDLEPTSPIGREPDRWGVTIPKTGLYDVASGMSHRDAMVLVRKFQFEADMRLRTMTWERLRYLAPGHNRRTMLFLAASHGLMGAESADAHLREERADDAFPMVLGDLQEDPRPVLHPVATDESLPLHKVQPPPPLEVGPVEARLVRLADGSRSVRQLVAAAGLGCDDAHRARDFLRVLITARHALVFARPWHRRRPAEAPQAEETSGATPV